MPTINIDRELHHQLKAAAVKKRMSMQALVDEWLIADVTRELGGGEEIRVTIKETIEGNIAADIIRRTPAGNMTLIYNDNLLTDAAPEIITSAMNQVMQAFIDLVKDIAAGASEDEEQHAETGNE
jgi:hypothetical protein